MNGFSVCNKLKRDAAFKDVPLIIMSSESTEETFEQHRRLRTRAEDYVHKPIGFDALLGAHSAVRRIVDSGSSSAEPADRRGATTRSCSTTTSRSKTPEVDDDAARRADRDAAKAWSTKT